MRANYKLITAVFAVASLGAPATAQQSAKSGTYTGKYGPHAVGQTYEIGKGHVFFVGMFHGVFYNDVAGGFIDKTEWTCPGVNDIVEGVSASNHGYCIGTDKDGDKVFFVWQGKGTVPGSGEGAFQWTGGSGKYSGIQGQNTFRFTGIGNTAAFSVVWQGERRLP
jgi:hypothetical protein